MPKIIQSESAALGSLLFEGVCEEAKQAKGMSRMASFGLSLLDEADKIVGGAQGVIYYGCLYVDMLWVDKRLRSQGWGAKLMAEAEMIGRNQHCTFATVNTMDWEALPFYQKIGYEIEFIRKGYEKESKLYMLRKPLY